VKLGRERAQQGLGLFPVKAVNAPDHLVLFGGSIQEEIGNWRVAVAAHGTQRRGRVFVQIQVDVTDFTNALFCSREAVCTKGIHSQEDVGPHIVLFLEPILKVGTRMSSARRMR